jgi:putative peptidoglycan lipid II flippase
MKLIAICTLALAAACGVNRAQPPAPPPPEAAPAPPPPAPPAANAITVSGPITQFNFGPDGAVDGLVISGNTLVHLPRETVAQLGNSLRPGVQVTITGIMAPSASTMQVMDAETIQAGGWTLTVPAPRPRRGRRAAPPPPPPPAGACPTPPPPPPPPR